MGIRPGRIDQDSSLTSDALLLAMVQLVEGIGVLVPDSTQEV